jgi:hypothetical protein
MGRSPFLRSTTAELVRVERHRFSDAHRAPQNLLIIQQERCPPVCGEPDIDEPPSFRNRGQEDKTFFGTL